MKEERERKEGAKSRTRREDNTGRARDGEGAHEDKGWTGERRRDSDRLADDQGVEKEKERERERERERGGRRRRTGRGTSGAPLQWSPSSRSQVRVLLLSTGHSGIQKISNITNHYVQRNNPRQFLGEATESDRKQRGLFFLLQDLSEVRFSLTTNRREAKHAAPQPLAREHFSRNPGPRKAGVLLARKKEQTALQTGLLVLYCNTVPPLFPSPENKKEPPPRRHVPAAASVTPPLSALSRTSPLSPRSSVFPPPAIRGGGGGEDWRRRLGGCGRFGGGGWGRSSGGRFGG